MDKRKILELDIDVEAIISKSVQLKTELDKLKASQLELNKAGDTNSETYVKLAAQLNKVSTEYGLNQKQLASLAQVNGNYLTINQKVGLSLDKEINSIASARSNNSELLKVRNELNLKNTDQLLLAIEINKKMDENNKFIKENVSGYEQQKIGIGDYKTAITNALNETGLFGDKLNQLKNINESVKQTYSNIKAELQNHIALLKDIAKGTEGMTIAQKASVVATNLSTSGLQVLKVAFASVGIGLVVLALGALIGYFTQTQAGINKLNSVLIPLKTIFSAISGVVSELGGKLVDTFSNPKKALEDLGNFVKQNLINRFTAFGKILDGILTLDFKKVANGALQAGTGVENLTGKIANGAKASAKFLEDNARKGAEIAKLTKETEEAQIKYNGQQRKTGDLIDAQLLISKDTSRTFAEREAASREIIRLTKGLGEAEEAIIDKKIRQLKIQMSLGNVTNEQKRQLEELLNAKEDAGDRGVEAEKEQIRVIAGARKEVADKAKAQEADRITKQKEAIDKAIANSKIELDYFIAQQGEKAKSLSGELKLANDIKDKKLAILKQELTANKITQKEFDLQSLNAKQEFLLKQTELTLSYSKADFDLFLSQNESKLNDAKLLTQGLIDEESKRLEDIRVKKQAQLELEKNTNQSIIDAKIANNESLSIADLEYLTQKNAIELENKTQNKTNTDALEAQTKEQKASQLQADNEIALADAATKLEEDTILAQQQHESEVAMLDEKLKNQALTQSQYDAKVIQADNKKKEMMRLAELNDTQGKLNEYKKLGEGLQGLFGKNKLIASALAGVNTALAVTEILKTPSVLPEPMASISRAVQIGTTIATGVKSIAEINGAKFAKGVIDLEGPGTGTSDSIPARISRGESVINAKSTAMFKPLLAAINQAGGGVGFAGGGIPYPASVLNTFNNTQSSQVLKADPIDYDLLASKIGMHVGNANLNLPKPIVYTAITDINYGQDSYAQVVDGANL